MFVTPFNLCLELPTVTVGLIVETLLIGMDENSINIAVRDWVVMSVRKFDSAIALSFAGANAPAGPEHFLGWGVEKFYDLHGGARLHVEGRLDVGFQFNAWGEDLGWFENESDFVVRRLVLWQYT